MTTAPSGAGRLADPRLHRVWLRITALGIGIFGPVCFLGTMPATDWIARAGMDFLAFPPDGGTAWDHPDTRFLSALTGGFLLGWGVMVWCLAAWVHPLAPELVRRSVLAGLVAWFLLDSAGSIASGTWPNAIINIAVLALLAGPLWWRTRA